MGRMFRWVRRGLVWLVILICLSVTVVPPFLDRIYYTGPVSDHFDGQRFFNPDGGDDGARPPTGGSRAGFFLRWLTSDDERAVWPDNVPVTPSKPAARVKGETMVATWVGHATMLVQTQGLNILTDPIWAERAGPFGIGPKRVTAPGIRIGDLPKIDLILVSHNHYDHMDLDSLKRIGKRDEPLIVTSLGNETLLKGRGLIAVARDWGQRVAVRPGIDVIVTRNHHWGSRWGTDQRRALWSSFVVTLPGGNIFFAGDTGYGDGQWPIEAARYGPVRLAILPIGAFRFAKGMMDTGSHIGPIQAVEIFKRLGASTAIPIHWGTFQLSYEARDTPPRMLAEALACSGLPFSRFAPVAIGVPTFIPPYAAPAHGRAPDRACLTAPPITKLR